MWVMSAIGFYSAVQHRADPQSVLVRARVRSDLTALLELDHELARQSLGMREPVTATVETTMTADYPFRILIPKARWEALCAAMAALIDYPNFKGAVAQRQGAQRASAYHKVWCRLLDLEREDAELAGVTPYRLLDPL